MTTALCRGDGKIARAGMNGIRTSTRIKAISPPLDRVLRIDAMPTSAEAEEVAHPSNLRVRREHEDDGQDDQLDVGEEVRVADSALRASRLQTGGRADR